MSLISNTMNKTKEAKTTKVKNHIADEYKSKLDYSILGIKDSEKEILVGCEKELLRGLREVEKGSFTISKALYEAQETLASYNGGTFYKWFESLGLKKTFVYMALKRYKMHLKYNDKKILEFKDRTITDISKLEKELEPGQIKEVLKDPNPSEKIQELKNELSVRRTSEKEPDFQEIKKYDFLSETFYKKIKEISLKDKQELEKHFKKIEKILKNLDY